MAKKTVVAAPSRSRGQIIPKGDNKWLIRVYLGRENGKRKYSSSAFTGTKRAAEQELTKKLRELDTDTFVVPSKDDLGSFVLRWLDSKKLQDYSRHVYLARINADILPSIGKMALQGIGPADVQAWVDDLNKRLSPATVRYSYMILSSVMKKAQAWGMIQKSPCVEIELPAKVKREPTVLSSEDTKRFLESTKGTALHAFWTILLTCGLRPGEVMALKFTDFDGSSLVVSKALKFTRGKNTVKVGEPKTAAGRREISVPSSTARVIEQHRARMYAETARGIRPLNPEGWMFLTKSGRFYTATNVRTLWKASLRRAGLPTNVRVYDSRHSHLTHLLENGVSPKVASERAGHSSVQILLDVYSHVTPKLKKETADLVDNLIFGTGT